MVDGTATVAAVFNVSGNLLLLPVHGIWAVVWMTVATEMVLCIDLSAVLFHVWKNIPSARLGGNAA